MNGIGTLIRQLRMEKNFSQAGLCRGVCAASYLSKIEQGQVEAGPEILDRLFAALGVQTCRDEGMLAEAEEMLTAYFDGYERFDPPQSAARWLEKHRETLRYSALHLDLEQFRLYRLMEADRWEESRTLFKLLDGLKGQMTPEQRYRHDRAVAEDKEDTSAEALEALRQAERQKPCAIARYNIAYVLYIRGDYGSAMEAADQAYHMAAEEGDLFVLIRASFLLGSCYSGVDLKLAEKYYCRAIRLTGGETETSNWSWYNLGASYLEQGDLEKARFWLTKCQPMEGYWHHNAMLAQKRALLWAELGERDQAREAVDTAQRELEGKDGPTAELYREMVDFAAMLLEPDYLSDPNYEKKLTGIYQNAWKDLGFGFLRFYGRYLVRLYQSQRRYKDALRVTQEMEKTNFLKEPV